MTKGPRLKGGDRTAAKVDEEAESRGILQVYKA